MKIGVVAQWVLVVGLVLMASSCGRFAGSGKAAPNADPSASASSDTEEALRSAVQSYVNSVNASGDSGDVVRVKPYFYKQYEQYSGEPATAEIEFLESDSLTTPRIAQITLEKQRFATKMHRKRDDARADSSFFRGTGEETLTFAYRNGRWEKTSSLFVAERLEENINGEWVPVREEVERALSAEDEEAGWFKRAISTITGRY